MPRPFSTRDSNALRTAQEKIAAADSAPGVRPLARALCIEAPHEPPGNRGIIEQWMERHPTTALGRWVHTHPPIEARIAWLRSLEGALEVGP
jgi:hypothetical protein